MMMRFRAVLFDLDGTLLNTIDDLTDSLNTVLMKLGYPTHDAESVRYFVGSGMRNLVRLALPEEARSDEIISRAMNDMRNEYAKRWANKTRPYEGVDELLDSLVDLEIKMAILSNKPDDFTKLSVSKLLPKWQFDAVVGVLPGGPIKPDPTAAIGIAEKLGIPNDRFLYLGDTGTDMKTANAAGMFAVGALWGFRERNELLENGARELIEHPVELLKFIRIQHP